MDLLRCPRCTGPLVAAGGGARCLGCDHLCVNRNGVLDLVDPKRPPEPRIRRYPHGGKNLDFYAFFEAGLKMRAYASTTLEDEVYELLHWIDPTPEEPQLVLGAGAGEWALFLCAAVNDVPMILADDDDDALAMSRKLLSRSEGSPVLLVRCDLDHPPFGPGAFAGALEFGVLHGVADAAAHLGKVGRTLRARAPLGGLSLARSSIPQIAQTQAQLAARGGLRFVAMEELAQKAVRAGWSEFRHEQPSNWMARYRLRRAV